MNSAVFNIALLAFVIVTWGYSWILMKIGLGYAKPYTFAAWRCGIGAVALLAYIWWKGPKFVRKSTQLSISNKTFVATIIFEYENFGLIKLFGSNNTFV